MVDHDMSVRLDIKREPMGVEYCLLLEALLTVCSRALLVVRDDLTIGSQGKEKLKCLKPYLVSRELRRDWPGTELLSGTARVQEYRFDGGCCETLGQLVDGLYGWRQPDAPEDLCLLRHDRSPALVSIAHEEDAYLDLTSQELRRLEDSCEGWPKLLESLLTEESI